MIRSANAAAGASRATELERLLARLREEHAELLTSLDRLDEAAEQAERLLIPESAYQVMRKIAPQLARFLAELERHAQLEEEELIPIVDVYFHRKRMPSMTASIWVMEKDHELADVYLKTCLQRLEAYEKDMRAAAIAEAIHCLIQGCSLIKEHFIIEENTLFPLAEELLTDMDYLFA